ncbi:MAG: prefoldin subunit alpha [Methanomicrobiales archaeon]|nr:prefoldin subunit alpha [Methanomicrobiales archaeon]MDI6875303.1 prefoldin subunit alpha [Methanomicrobiales archaeon]
MASEMERVDARELQTLQVYLNEYGQQMEIMGRQLEAIEQRRLESAAAIEALQSLKEQGGGVVLLPLGGGVTLRVRVEQPDKVLVNIGADVVVEKTNDDARVFLQDRATELEALAKRVASSMDQIRNQMTEIARRIETGYRGEEGR